MKQKLQEPLPPEAISPHPTKTYLSSIKGIYVTERLNEVFGVGAWSTKVEFQTMMDSKERKDGTKPQMVVVKLCLEIPEYEIYYEAYGGNDNEDLGDAYKGAMTDALTKIGSFMGIGIDVFKGKHTKNEDIKSDNTNEL